MIMKISLVISTYNWPEALDLCLKSVLNQSRIPDEVIIADDGSNDDTRKVIDNFIQLCSFPVKHIWHEDLGHRKTVILNKAIAACNSDYIIETDGDIILHRHFVKDHFYVAKKGFFVRGARVLLTEELTKMIMLEKQIGISYFQKGLTKRRNCIHFPFIGKYTSFFYKSKSPRYVIGCNIAFWKNDLIAINGYNEDIKEWGYEDNEIAARLINNGVYKRVIRWGIIAYHLYHPQISRERSSINENIYNETVSQHKVWSENGLDKYL